LGQVWRRCCCRRFLSFVIASLHLYHPHLILRPLLHPNPLPPRFLLLSLAGATFLLASYSDQFLFTYRIPRAGPYQPTVSYLISGTFLPSYILAIYFTLRRKLTESTVHARFLFGPCSFICFWLGPDWLHCVHMFLYRQMIVLQADLHDLFPIIDHQRSPDGNCHTFILIINNK